jgi:hypothetical protein
MLDEPPVVVVAPALAVALAVPAAALAPAVALAPAPAAVVPAVALTCGASAAVLPQLDANSAKTSNFPAGPAQQILSTPIECP